MRFIVIDDEELNLFLAEKIITKALGPQDLKMFTSGGAALRYLKEDFKYKSNKAAIVFLDLNMPVISGWDFLEFFDQFDDELKSAVYLYIVTSSIDPEERDRALLNPNVIAFVTKPITPSFILSHFKISS